MNPLSLRLHKGRKPGQAGCVSSWLQPRKLFQSNWTPKLCQWIEGEPSFDENCKCLKPVIPSKPYCEAHYKRAYKKIPVANDA